MCPSQHCRAGVGEGKGRRKVSITLLGLLAACRGLGLLSHLNTSAEREKLFSPELPPSPVSDACVLCCSSSPFQGVFGPESVSWSCFFLVGPKFFSFRAWGQSKNT